MHQPVRSSRHRPFDISVCVAIVAVAVTPSFGSGMPTCEEAAWLPTFASMAGVSDEVHAQKVFDDGRGGGPALYVGGDFLMATGVQANHVARWSGSSWTSLGGGLDGTVYALEVFDDGLGGGPALYAGGAFKSSDGVSTSHIARWDGANWQPVGSGVDRAVHALTVFDDGSGGGPALYAGGEFMNAGGVAAQRIAKWNGKTWAPLGNGISGGTKPRVLALTVHDDIAFGGPALYAGGEFTTAGIVAASNIAVWDGRNWSSLSTGTNGAVRAMMSFEHESASGVALYAGGDFTTAGSVTANRIAKWDGKVWVHVGSGSTPGPGYGSTIRALAVFDDGTGSGPMLHAGGRAYEGSLERSFIMKWNGTTWIGLPDELHGGSHPVVSSLVVFDDGLAGGAALFAGGSFAYAEGVAPGPSSSIPAIPASCIARWSGTHWSTLGGGTNHPILATAVFDDGSGNGPQLYAGGMFTRIGGVPANRVAKFNGTTWEPLGSGVNQIVRAMTVFHDGSGSGPALYVGGDFSNAGGASANRIAKWDGAAWTPLGAGLAQGIGYGVEDLVVFDDGSEDGPALYATGIFFTAGGQPASCIAKWNGKTWSPLGADLDGGQGWALAVFDDGLGEGPVLVVVGNFSQAGGVPATDNFAKWNGTQWSAFSSWPAVRPAAATVFDDGSGSGPALYVGGQLYGFPGGGGVTKWDGKAWTMLGGALSGGDPSVVWALAGIQHDSSGAPALYAAGDFTTTDSIPVNYIARWNGAAWVPVGSGTSATIHAMTVFDDGSAIGPAIVVGGEFLISGAGDAVIARWGCAEFGPPPCVPADFKCDGVVDGTDLAVVLGAWGACGSPPCAADLNDDDVIDGNDLAILLGAWR